MIKLDLQLAELGKIKIGGKGESRPTRDGKGTFRLPVKFDHFVITTLNRDENGDFIPDKEMMSHYPPNPKSLNIFFLYDRIDNIFQTQFALYTGSECRCSGDGRKAMRKLRDGSFEEVDCNPETCEFYQNKKCKIGGVLNCLIAESQSVGGVYKLRTHSFHSVRNILSSLTLIKAMTNGILSGIKFCLTISPKAVSVNGKATTIHILNIEYKGLRNGLLDTVLEIKRDRIAFNVDMKQLELKATEVGEMTADEIKDITDEWYPESQKEPTVTKEKIAGKEVDIVNNSEQLSPPAEDVPKTEVDSVVSGLIKKNIALVKELGMKSDEWYKLAEKFLDTKKMSECKDAVKLAKLNSHLDSLIEYEKAKAAKKAKLDEVKDKIQAIYDEYKVPTGKQREYNIEMLGTAELKSSRTLSKLNMLLASVQELLVNYGENEDEEELL